MTDWNPNDNRVENELPASAPKQHAIRSRIIESRTGRAPLLDRRIAEYATMLRAGSVEDGERLLREFAASLEEFEIDVLFERLAAEVPVELRARVVEARILRWAEIDPEAVAGALLAGTPGKPEVDLLARVLAQWGRDDWKAAVSWARELPDSAEKSQALIRLASFWNRAEPESAAVYAQGLPPGEERTRLMTMLAAQWAERDPQAAIAWAERLVGDSSRDKMLASLIATWGQRDELAAAEFVLRMPPGAERQNATISVLSAMARDDPAFALQWANELQEPGVRRYALENVFYRWAESAPESALAGVARFGPGPDRDVALHAIAGSLVNSDPGKAAKLALEIGDESLRNAQAERAVRAWLAADPTVARIWIAQSSLPSSMKQRLLL